MKRLVLIDGNSLIHRAYHAVPALTTSSGELVNAVFGFTSMLLKVFSELKPEYVCVCFDRKEPTFRHKKFADYKATRAKTDLGLVGQFERTEEMVSTFNIPIFSKEGYEADDLIATLALQAKEQKTLDEVVIVTGDRDTLQLVDEKIKVYSPGRTFSETILYDEGKIREKYRLEPAQLVDFKALAGDQSDNVPGVLGIGEVTATKLIEEFKDLESLYRGLEKLPEKIRLKLEKDREMAFLSKFLVTLDLNVPIKLDLGKCLLADYDKDRVLELFEKLQFRSLIKRLPDGGANKGDKGDRGGGDDGVGDQKVLDIFGGGEAITYDSLDNSLGPVLAKMSKTGVLVDRKILEEIGSDLDREIKKIEKEIYSVCGFQFNLNSPKQLAKVLFEDLGLPVGRKIKTGRSTDEITLKALKGTHPAIELILKYRELFKLKSTYIESLMKFIGEDGRIHSVFRLDATSTGRLSSSSPNLQNIPIKGEWGNRVRSAFVAPKGRVLLSADYSQIELRVMAHVCQDPGLLEAFAEGEDIHAATAASIFKISLDKVTADQRRVAKTVNFGLLYGMSAHGLASELGCDYETARSFMEGYFEHFPKVKFWINETLKKAYETGYVETLLGRRRYIPELKASGRLRLAGERMAINMPIQGTAADIIKKAMVEIDREVQNSKFKDQRCKLILQVHDELLFECDPNEIKETAKMVKEKMEKAFLLTVPILAEVKVGADWARMEQLEI